MAASSSTRAEHDRADLTVGVILVPDFTLLAFAGFIDALRLAADRSDRSRPIHCRWYVMTATGRPVRSSCGVMVSPTSGFVDPRSLDYVVVVAGILHNGRTETPAVYQYLSNADALRVPLIGLCTGSFVLARASLMNGRLTCVSWLHYNDFKSEFPDLDACCDRLYLDDRNRITCAGGTSVIDVASMLIDRHCGSRRSEKGLRIMIEERLRTAAAPQPTGVRLPESAGRLVRRALLRAEQQAHLPVSVTRLASQLGTSRRTLERRCRTELGRSPSQLVRSMKLQGAHDLVRNSALTLTEIADVCGFANAAHLSRAYRAAYGLPPSHARKRT